MDQASYLLRWPTIRMHVLSVVHYTRSPNELMRLAALKGPSGALFEKGNEISNLA